MFEHILVPVDGSSTAGLAIDKAVGLARAFNSTVTLIYVIDPYAFTGVGTDLPYGQAQYLSAATAEAHEALEAARLAFEAQGIVARTSVVEGHAVYRAILEAAQAVDADLLVMGSHKRHGLEKLVLGSVTAQVLSHAHLSVLVVCD